MDQGQLDRLVSDMRTLSPLGIERVAWGWDRHERDGLDRYHEAEKTALAAVERAGLGEAWDAFRRSLFELTESRGALTSWRAEHGEHGHKAERAAYGAALGLFARDHIPHAEYTVLVRPMAEALPWLLPEIPPQPLGRNR
jgi:hypothetical protein